MNSNYTCAIVDDEPDAIELLKQRIGLLYPNIQVKGTFLHWQEAVGALQTHKYDILFSDISMPGKNGLDILKMLPDLDCEIIFVTAHEDYALKAFSFAASGYVLKPIDDGELQAAIARSIERVMNKSLARESQKMSTVAQEKLKIPGRNSIDYVNVADILYLESVNKCTQIIGAGFKYLSSANLGNYKYLTESKMFFQVHRSFIVNLNAVTRYSNDGAVIMTDGKEIPVARSSRQDFLSAFEKNA
ncbi:MAG: response regulator transcription factor [Taibaiella sp.]|nr:response regulator transcription factor [Taibaiella sp.]